jgi:preprotein translocase subunit Sss1
MYTALIIGVIGLLIWATCSRLEGASLTSDVFFSAEHKAREAMVRAERVSRQHEKSQGTQAVRFFKSLGVGLTVIGFGGALVYVLAFMT